MDLQQNKNSIFTNGVSWWFVFKDVNTPILKMFLKPGYQHVFALTRMKNLTLVVEPLLGATNLSLTDANIAELLAEFKMAGFTVVHFRHPPTPHKFKIRTPLITCASYLAYTVGIRFFGFTAWQLYKKIMKKGGEVI